jgi:hypothetical protein
MWGLRLFCVPTVLFQTLHVGFVIRLPNREILHVAVTQHPSGLGRAANRRMLRLEIERHRDS